VAGSGTDSFEHLSLWFDTLGERVAARPRLDGDLDADVAIVGAGYTGLWTAVSLLEQEPSARVAVVEQQVAGFGASGRNGGWCSAFFAVPSARLARMHGLGEMHRMAKAMHDTVDEVGRQAGKLGIDCQYRKGGSVSLARSPAQVSRIRTEIREARELGFTESDLRWLEADEASRLVSATGVEGGLFTPHCAAVHPARLVRGLASAAERAGVRIYEQTPVLSIEPAEAASGRRPVVRTESGTVRADTVVIATEGFTARLPGRRRDVVPLYSLMVATEPLDGSLRETVGAAGGVTFTDGRHLIIYGQLTADGRIAFGGRGAPYHFGSEIRSGFDRVPRMHAAIATSLVELFPSLSDVAITHRWGGPLGVHRDWYPSVSFDQVAGIAIGGGYVGDGVATANLAGRTLADLVLRRETDLTSLCWVGHRSRRWETEPFRYLGVNGGLVLTAAADRAEARSGRPSRLGDIVTRITGH
jgi:glycine/D-amino acid oxidase-like deaminating enzyme